ncbi:uncharacterized protein BDW70DRAFT_145520 [Aspergillus foveolatus]|uniref:uncharacterized protein n=1 Tax=Aspergillus foveolatus TaxID=210207 RepID=UPI003CCD8C4C
MNVDIMSPGNASPNITFSKRDTVRDVLDRVQEYYDIPHRLYWGDNVPDSTLALHLLEKRSIHVVDDPVQDTHYTIMYNTATGEAGVYRNSALDGAKQTNIGAGPGSSTWENRAVGYGTEQTNTSVCVIL